MEAWKQNIINIDPSVEGVILKNDSINLIYAEYLLCERIHDVNPCDAKRKIKEWRSENGKLIYEIFDDYFATIYDYDENGREILCNKYQSINTILCVLSKSTITEYDKQGNIIYEKYFDICNKTKNKTTERFAIYKYNKSGIIIKEIKINKDYDVCIFWFDENGKLVRSYTRYWKNTKRNHATKRIAILNPSKTGYRRCSFFGYDQEIFDEEWETVYHKYKLNKKEAQNEN